MHIITSLTPVPGGSSIYGTVEWGDGSANDAVTVDISMAADKAASAAGINRNR